MLTCVFCKNSLAPEHARYHHVDVGEDPWPRCPHCGRLGVFRTRTAIGAIVYCQALLAGELVYESLFFDKWTPEELEAIARDLREQQAAGNLHYVDGSGSGKAGRREHTRA